MSVLTAVLFLTVCFYAFAYFWEFSLSPLGRHPILDAKELLKDAESINTGTCPQEPFYRAMGYGFWLSFLYKFAQDQDLLMVLALLSGCIFHLLNTLIAAKISKELWHSDKSVYFTLFLYGFNPVMLYFAVKVSDVTFSIFFLLFSIYFWFVSRTQNKSARAFLSGLCLGISSIIRFNILPSAIIYLIGLFRKSSRKNSIAALIALLIVIFSNGILCLHYTGTFKIMPWQGSYNLYAGNREGANGKYYSNSFMIPPELMIGNNPARTESELIYSYETGKIATTNIKEFNIFWYKKLFNEIKQNPSQWLLLMVKKFIYLINNFEQHNITTYSFHKENSSLLKHNPICFGIIFILFGITLCSINSNQVNKKNFLKEELKELSIILLFLSLGLTAFFVSAKLRIIIVPIMVVYSAGLFTNNVKLSLKTILTAVLFSFLTFNSFFEANSTKTYSQDCILLSTACERSMDYEGQFFWAEKACKLSPHNEHSAIRKLLGISNMIIFNKNFQLSYRDIKEQVKLLNKSKLIDKNVNMIMACYFIFSEKDMISAKKYIKGISYKDYPFFLCMFTKLYLQHLYT